MAISDRPRRPAAKTQADQDGGRHGHRCAETGCALEEGTEGKGNQQQLDAAVFGDAGNRVLQDLEAAVLLGQLVQEDDVEHDPANGQQAGEAAQHGRAAGHVGRHVVDENGNDQRCHQARTCGPVGFHMQKPRPTSITTTGMAASKVDNHIFDSGSYTCCQIIFYFSSMNEWK